MWTCSIYAMRCADLASSTGALSSLKWIKERLSQSTRAASLKHRQTDASQSTRAGSLKHRQTDDSQSTRAGSLKHRQTNACPRLETAMRHQRMPLATLHSAPPPFSPLSHVSPTHTLSPPPPPPAPLPASPLPPPLCQPPQGLAQGHRSHPPRFASRVHSWPRHQPRQALSPAGEASWLF